MAQKNFSVDSQPEVLVRAERVVKIKKDMDVSSARSDAWTSMRCDPENWTRRERERRSLPAGVTMIETVEEAQAEMERYWALTREWEEAQQDLRRERSASRQRLRQAHGPEYESRKKAVAKTAAEFTLALGRERELAGLFVDDGALYVSSALDVREPASALRCLLLDLVGCKLLDAAAIPPIPELEEKPPATEARQRNDESAAWRPAFPRPGEARA